MTAVEDAARILTLVPWLLARPGASVAEAATAMGATESQIRSDLERVDFCGLPGLGGGDLMEVEWHEDRVVLRLADELRRPLRPTTGEAVRMQLAAETVLAVSAEPPAALVSALEKVRTAAGVPDDVVQSVVDQSPWLDQLRDVLAGTTCIEIEYQGREDDAPRTRRIDPWQLELLDGQWYLHGRDRDIGQGRVFRLDRISAIVATTDPRGDVPDALPTPSYEPEEELSVTVVITPSARWLANVLDNVSIDEDGPRATLRFGTDSPRHIAEIIARAAGEATVLEPSSLRELVVEHAQRALAAYAVRP